MPSLASLPKASRWPPRLGLLGLAVMLAPLVFPEGTLRSYDWDLQLIWITRFHQALEAGQWWPQWLDGVDGGRGAPVFVFYPPLAYYLTSLGMAISEDPVWALKLGLSAAAVIGYVTSLRLFNTMTDARTAAILAVCAALSPAWLFMAFRVHMLAGALALAFFPLALDGVMRIYMGRPVTPEPRTLRPFGGRHGLQIAGAIGLIGWTHLPMLLMSVAALLLLLLMAWKRLQGQRLAVLSGLALGMALSAAPMMPALLESGLVSLHALQSDALDWKRNFLFSQALLAEPRGFRSDHVFLSVFAAAWLLWVALAAGSAWHSPRGKGGQKTCLFWALALFWMSTPLAWPVYAMVPALQMLQFPWRWLPLAHLAGLVALAAGRGCMSRAGTMKLIGLALILAGHMTLFFDVGLVVQMPRTSKQEERWVVQTMPRVAPEYRPRTLRLPSGAGAAPATLALADSRAIRITALEQRHVWKVEAETQGVLHLGIACFPGWVVWAEGEKLETGCDAQGLLTAVAAPGTYRVNARFTATPVRKIGRAVSLAAFCFWLLGWRRAGPKTGGCRPSPGLYPV